MRCRFAIESLPLEATPVENLFILEHMPRADGNQLRVYLYGLMLCRYPSFDTATMGEALGLSEDELVSAFAHWQREGLVRITSLNPLDVEYVAPSERGNGPQILPGKYNQLVQAVQSIFAPRQLRISELRRVYDWIEVYNLEEEAVLELISHCMEQKGKKVSLSYIDAVAKSWADLGIQTPLQAKEEAARFKAMVSGAGEILKRWNISRLPTKDELSLYEKWNKEMGFDKEGILRACSALTKSDKPTFAYLNGVLDNLYKKGVVSNANVDAHMQLEDKRADFMRDVFARLGRSARPNEREELMDFVDKGLPKDVLLFAAKIAGEKDKPIGYLKKLLAAFSENGVKTVEEAKANMDDNKKSYTKSKEKAVPKSMNYPQRRITEEEISHIILTFDEEEADGAS